MPIAPETPLVVMGVSGAGKSSIGSLLAGRMGAIFLDADDLHSEDARAKMHAGTPLTDEDRTPWLARVGARIAQGAPAGERLVVACSALRRRYRDALRSAVGGDVAFVWLDGDAQLLTRRLAMREGHFMPPSLLESQLATLEPLEADELGFSVSIAHTPGEIVDAILEHLRPPLAR
jgi:gluconokinase